jgi:hypothetical protein
MPLDGLEKISGGFTRKDQNPSLDPSRRAIPQRREENLIFPLLHTKDRTRLKAEILANLLRNHNPSETINGDLHALLQWHYIMATPNEICHQLSAIGRTPVIASVGVVTQVFNGCAKTEQHFTQERFI